MLVIDTEEQQYAVHWRGLLSIHLISGGRIRFWVLGWTKTINPWSFSSLFQPGKPKRKSSASVNRFRMSSRIVLRKIKRMLQTFQVKTCEVNLDTGHYGYNAYLYPVFGLLSRPDRRLRINFTGEVLVKIIIRNRLYRILLSFIFS